ncbi:PHP-associated domain-containing protein [Kosmotoga pacifica]|uniref:Polymerase/histidinol phosphatase N-terminal domain-containing protein n=1 Tax=Kosmotoga pacifica TaxID=1330330 RepID=A0A0G2ZCT6_9BACT|nr:PHP domain-containing protein [Kosmotoga pacifica]AKI97369.1 hypothetical protein IX53_05540 [Kosmotoga pacifica]
MLIDLHNHTDLSSGSNLALEDYVPYAKAYGARVAITDHDILNSEANEYRDFFFCGFEAITDYGHFLVFGASPELMHIQNIYLFIETVHAEGGIVIAAHPFRNTGVFGMLDTESAEKIIDLVDAVEVYNGRSFFDEWEKAIEIAKKFDKPMTGGSDALTEFDIFRVATEFPEDINTLEELIEQIRTGQCKPLLLSDDIG